MGFEVFKDYSWLALAIAFCFGAWLIISGLRGKSMGENVKNVVFKYKPEGLKEPEKIVLTGDFNKWNPSNPKYQMNKNSNGEWVVKISLKPGFYRFKFVKDGYFIRDMEAIRGQYSPEPVHFDNDHFNGKNAVIEVVEDKKNNA
jgi:hypothetical protein